MKPKGNTLPCSLITFFTVESLHPNKNLIQILETLVQIFEIGPTFAQKFCHLKFFCMNKSNFLVLVNP